MMEMTPDQRRRRAVRIAFQDAAGDFLRDQEPPPQTLALMTAAIVDAVMAGDRDLLAVVPSVLTRWRRYLPDSATWTSTWQGKLAELDLVAGLAEALLEQEAESEELSE